MKPQFIIIASKGALRAGWIEPAPLQPSRGAPQRQPRIRWVRELSYVHPREHLREQVTDLSGAFAPTTSSGGAATPFRMASTIPELHWKEEAQRKAVQDLAHDIEEVCALEKPAFWSLSAPAQIHNALRDALSEPLRETLRLLLPKDLAHAPSEVILSHFLSSS